jgi:twinkle protein
MILVGCIILTTKTKERKQMTSVEQYIESRGLSVEEAAKRGIVQADRPGNWIKIPYFQGGEVVNNKYRCVDEKKFSQDAGGEQIFYNYDCITDPSLKDQPLIIVEGEFDVLAVIEAGYTRVVSVPAGAPGQQVENLETSDKYNFFDNAANDLANHVGEIILAVDNDKNGKALQQDLAILIGRAKCKFITYPKTKADNSIRCKDLNEVLQNYGSMGVVKTIGTAQWLDVSGIHAIDEIPPQPDRESYPINPLGFNIKIRTRDFTVVTGVPNPGKSTFVDTVIFYLTKEYGLNVFMASFETHPKDDHLRKMLTWYYKREIRHMSEDELAEGMAWVKNHFMFMTVSEADEENGISLEDYKARARAAIVRHNAKILVLDPWNELDHKKRKNESTTEYTGRAIRELKAFARRNNVHLIVVAHPTKMPKLMDGKIEPPNLYSIADSANWYNKSDIGIVVHKADETTTMVDIQKTKHWEDIGRPEKKYFFFDPLRYEYTPSPSPEEKAEAYGDKRFFGK